jgi:lipoate-protein ligase A
MSRERWRRLPFNNEPAGRQLALSETLTGALETASLYWYEAARPAVILGAAQKPTILDLTATGQAGYAVYKRTSGGAVVLAGPGFLSLDVALPPYSVLASADVTRAYQWFGECWVDALARLEVSSYLVEPWEARQAKLDLAAASEAVQLVKLVCFGTLSSYEVASEDSRKLVGLAQVKRRGASLLQAGFHQHWPGSEFARILDLSGEQRTGLVSDLQKRAVGLDEVAGRAIPFPEIIAAFEASLRERYQIELIPGDWTPAELDRAAELEQEKFFALNVER